MILPENTKVLVAEDSLINRKLLELLFQKQNIDADFVENGLEVMEKLSGNTSYHILLLDLEMPEMNGYETAKEIRNALKSDLPIIAMSGHSDVQEKDKCLALGMNNYVSKPINMELLYDIMNELMLSKSKQETVKIEEVKQEFEFIDLTYFRTMSRGKPEFELSIFQMFIEDIPLQLHEMVSEINAGNYKLAAQIIHKMKSSLMMIGIQKIEALLVSLEHELIKEQLNENYPDQLTLIQNTINSAIHELRGIVKNIQASMSQ